jgi:hypothetical protein
MGKTLRVSSLLLVMFITLWAQLQSSGLPGALLHSLTDPDEPVTDSVHIAWAAEIATNGASSHDEPVKVLSDASGNVYVVGKAQYPASNWDILLIKYSPGGAELWRTRYDGPAHGNDAPSDFAISSDGTVYIVGSAIGYVDSEPRNLPVILSVSPAGAIQWTSCFSNSRGQSGKWLKVAVSPTGAVVVAGTIYQYDVGDVLSLSKLFCVAYSANQELLWERDLCAFGESVEGDVFLSIADNGKIHVGGNGGSNYRSLLVACEADGEILWRLWMGETTPAYGLRGLVTDDSGNVYCAGISFSPRLYGQGGRFSGVLNLTKVDNNGTLQWIEAVEGADWNLSSVSGITIEPAGTVLLAGSKLEGPQWARLESTFLLRYSASGENQWSFLIGPYSGSEIENGTLFVQDGTGSIYLSYMVHQLINMVPTMWDSLYTVKISTEGGIEWTDLQQFALRVRGQVHALTLDNDGNLIRAGSTGIMRSTDFVTTKVDPAGNELWESSASGDGVSLDSFTAMAADSAGNLYVLGQCRNSYPSWDNMVSKLSPDGTEQWRIMTDTSPNSLYSENLPGAITVDGAGNVFTTELAIEYPFGAFSRTTKIDNSGEVVWVARDDWHDRSTPSIPPAIELDHSGNVYVSAATQTLAYDRDGKLIWSRYGRSHKILAGREGVYILNAGGIVLLDSLGRTIREFPTEANDFAIDDSGNIYLTEHSVHSGEPERTEKLSPGGMVLWSASQGGERIALDRRGGIFVRRIGRWPEAQIIKLDGAGNTSWTAGFSGVAGGPYDFTLDAFGSVYICGRRGGGLDTGEGDFLVAKFDSSGRRLWTAAHDSPAGTVETPMAIALDRAGNVLVGGTAEHSNIANTIAVKKFTRVTTSVEEGPEGIATGYSLAQNYPNPFNPTTTIRFAILRSGHVEMKVYDLLGREVATLVNETLRAGNHVARWNAAGVPSGVYFCTMTAGAYVGNRKLVVLK